MILPGLLSAEDIDAIDEYHAKCQATAGQWKILGKLFQIDFLDKAREFNMTDVGEWIEKRIKPMAQNSATVSSFEVFTFFTLLVFSM